MRLTVYTKEQSVCVIDKSQTIVEVVNQSLYENKQTVSQFIFRIVWEAIDTQVKGKVIILLMIHDKYKTKIWWYPFSLCFVKPEYITKDSSISDIESISGTY
jgi:hypothetical protein